MPNWITNKLKAKPEIIASILGDDSHIDFGKVLPFPGPIAIGSYNIASKNFAEIAVNKPVSDHPLLAGLETHSRQNFDVTKLDDAAFEQGLNMIRNYRACGFLHEMDFQSCKWGSKWNACESTVDLDEGTANFETAWACPKPVLIELSKRFPDEEIAVTYADEDIGSNCGTFTLKGGQVIASDEAPLWRDMTDEQKAKW